MKCVSLFSGCGGLDLGLRNAGFSVAFATDNDGLSAKSHRINFPSTEFLTAAIEDIPDERFSALGDGSIDLLAGGPPCPPYSKSRFYRSDKPRALADPVADATLAGYLRALRLIRPTTFLLENVAGFAYKIHGAALDLLLRTANELGYTCNHGKLNAANYGVPQIRERYFVVGSTSGRVLLPTSTHSKPVNGVLPIDELLPWRTAGDVLTDLDTDSNAADDGHYAGGQYNHLLREIPPGDNYLYFTAKRGYPEPKFEWRSRYWSFLLKLSPDLPAWTIQARRSNNMGPFHWRSRILRIEEIKRLQTFPDNWHLAGGIEDQWRQVGNAVPPLLAERLGVEIATHLSRSKAA